MYLLSSLTDASSELLQGEEALALEEEPPAVYLTLEIGMLTKERLESCLPESSRKEDFKLDSIKVYGVPSPQDHSSRVGGAYAKL